MKSLLAIVALAWMLAIPAAAADSPEQSEFRFSDDKLRLLEVVIDDLALDEIISAYQCQDRLIVPLGAVAKMLGLAIEVHPESGTAEGFILREDRHFFLDLGRHLVVIAGSESSFEPLCVVNDGEDIYLDANLLSRWLPLRFDIDLFILQAKIHPQEPLPLQQRLARESRIAKTRQQLMPPDPDYDRLAAPYRSWSVPSIDQNLQFGMRHAPGQSVGNEVRYVTRAAADFLYMNSSWYVTGTDQDIIEDQRISFGRRDPYGELLGSLHATEYVIGHVDGSVVDLVTVPSPGRTGVMISSYPLSQQNQFDSHTFRGELLPGWEVELYHNNSLLGYQQARGDGQYAFENIPLLYGNNYFRLVFYGPQGQVREEEVNFSLDSSLTPAGKSYFDLNISQDDNHDDHLALKYDLGLSKAASVRLALAKIPVAGIDHEYQLFSLRGFGSGTFYGATLVNDLHGGKSIEALVQSRIGGINLALRDTHLDGFVSEVFPSLQESLHRHSEVRLDGAVPPSVLPRIPVTLEFVRDEFQGNATEQQARNRLALQWGGLALGNELTWGRGRDDSTRLTGGAMISYFAGGSSVRSDVYYSLHPESDIDSAILSATTLRFAPYSLRVGLERSFMDNSTRYTMETDKRVDGYLLTLGAEYSTSDEFALRLSWSMNFGCEPRRAQWQHSMRPMAERGAISARAYLDKDRNGVYGPGDEPLQGVGFALGGGYMQESARTDENGIAFLASLPPYQPLNLRLATQSLEEPLWIPAVEGWQVVTRPGNPLQIDFPVIETGEVDGTVYLAGQGEPAAIGGILVELVNQAGQVVKATKTSFDGYFTLSGIPLDSYRLRVNPPASLRPEVPSAGEMDLKFSPEQRMFYDLNFVLKPLASSPQ